MIEWEETDSGLRVFDRTKTEVCVEAEGWETTGAGHDIDRPLDATVSGYATEIRLPPALVTATNLTTGEEFKHGGETEALQLPEDDYLLNIDLNIKTYVKFSGSATVRKTEDFSKLHISLPGRTLLTFGFRSHHDEPIDTITVPPTPEGVSTAITHLSSAFKTTGPMRSYPTLRGHPARIELGEGVDIPERVREQRHDVDIKLVVPDSFDYVFVAAPLGYYLQAEIMVADRETPVLRAPSVGVEHEFSTLPDFQHDAVETLRSVFFLDCLVRNAGEYSWDLAELDLLDDLGIDAEEIYESTPAEQLATYLDAPYERIDDELPEWHLATHVAPAAENAKSLPYILKNLSVIYIPESTNLEKNELLNKSINDFYRAGKSETRPSKMATTDAICRSSSGPVESVDRRDPVLHEGRVNGWLADGVPIDVFKAVPEAFENYFDYLNQEGDDIDVTVILNDEEMVEEHETVAEIYRDRSEDLPIEITIHEHLTRAELAEVFESPHDFVHYIGHCEKDGLRCRNGNLAISDIKESKVQTFFLNACGSYYEGSNLVRKGSVAGAVTFTKVLNKQAAKVGVTFARLLINGFSMQQALQYARRRIMMGKDYAVVGDGTHVLTQCDNYYPSIMFLEKRDEKFELVYDQVSISEPGGAYQVYLEQDNKTHLNGTKSTFVLSWDELAKFLDRAKAPIIYDGDLYWSKELVEILQ